MKKISLLIVVFTLTITNANAKMSEKKIKDLVFNTGYALQAGLICDNLKYLISTTKEVSDKIGVANIRDDYKTIFYKGSEKAISDEQKLGRQGLCDKAWRLFGCNGKRTPKLLSESFRTNPNPQICHFGN